MKRGLLIILYPVLLPLAFIPVLFFYAWLTPSGGGALQRPATLYLVFLMIAGWEMIRRPSYLPATPTDLLRAFRRHYLANVISFSVAVAIGQLVAAFAHDSAPSASRDKTIALTAVVSWIFLWFFLPFFREVFHRPRPTVGQLDTIEGANRRAAIRRRQKDALRAKDSAP